jgi:hypothetical protein
MAVQQQGSNIVVSASVAGSVFPTSEKDTIFPVLVDGSKNLVRIEGALYGRSVELRGQVSIHGPVVARGDLKINHQGQKIQLFSGLTVNGSLNCHVDETSALSGQFDSVKSASLIVKGDIAANQNISLKNAVVFGSIRAVNCTLENTLVLGTCIIEESLTLRMSSVGGYAARDVSFEGSCMMIHALGESLNRPRMMPFETAQGQIIASDIRYYPAIRSQGHLFNLVHRPEVQYPDYSILNELSDWVESPATPNAALEEWHAESLQKWVLSIGGRIGDISVIASAIEAVTRMLKCGFEYEHYHPQKRRQIMTSVTQSLTEEEAWTLETVCL